MARGRLAGVPRAPRPAWARPSPCSTRAGGAASGAPTWSSASSRRTGARRRSSQLRDLEVVPRRHDGVPRHPLRGDGRRCRPGPQAAGRAGGRDGPHERAGQPAREAVAGHRGPPRRRHRRDLDGEHPAPREHQRRGREDHRRRAARDRPRRRRAPSRPDRAGGHVARGPAASHGPREHLPGRARRRRAGQLLPAGEPRRPPRAGAAVGGRPRRGQPADLHGRPRHRRRLGDPGARGRGHHRCAGGRSPHPARRPHGHPPGRSS